MNALPFFPGDVVLFSYRDMAGRIVNRMQTHPGETVAAFNHVGVMVDPVQCVEARWRVLKTDLSRYLTQPKLGLVVARMRGLSTQSRYNIALHAMEYFNRPYGWSKLLLHVGDYILSRALGRDVIFFRPWSKLQDIPICSIVVAAAYQDALGYRFGGVDKMQASPDDIGDDVLHGPGQWEIVYKNI